MSTGNLLNDEQMRQFVANGFIQIQTSLPEETHRRAHERTRKAFGPIGDMESDRKYNPGNNIMPIVPELHDVLADKNVVGALTSLVGENYLIHPHRHCHPNFPARKVESQRRTIMGVHKDGHADGNPKPRHRHPRWLLLFYFPHPCPERLGPTCIVPGSHYYHRIRHTESRVRNVPVRRLGDRFLLPEGYVNREFLPLSAGQGAVSIIHFDVVHSVVTNIGAMSRYAHKFVVMRTKQPDSPSWDNADRYWKPDSLPETNESAIKTANQEILMTYMWNWLRGTDDLFETDMVPTTSISDLTARLDNDDVQTRLGAVSTLGFYRGDAKSAVDRIVRLLRDPSDSVRLNATYTLGAIGGAAVDQLMSFLRDDGGFYREHPVLNVSNAAHALAAAGAEARGALADGLGSPLEHVRAWSAYALGEMGATALAVVPKLLTLLDDKSLNVRRHAISALGIIGVPQNTVEPALRKTFLHSDENDERIYALQALIRIGGSNEETIDALAAGLGDEHPYIAAFSAEQLMRVSSEAALERALPFLRRMRYFPHAIA